ncbi:hypothetical protein C8J57DRAFT_1215272 [Mycena rebaudengoi]|nr:hypothetical protein C8J57DRAFT_1215272 [Mycena rebaudengoi]
MARKHPAQSSGASILGSRTRRARGGDINATYFGFADAPRPLSVYNTQALVGFKPVWKTKLQDDITPTDQESKSDGVEMSLFSLNTTMRPTITGDTNNGYIIGFMQDTFWS